MKFQKLPDFEIIYSFRYISIIVVIRLQWENFMRATHYLYSYLRVCIKCLHCKFHSKDNIIITDWIYFTWKKKTDHVVSSLSNYLTKNHSNVDWANNKLAFVIWELHSILDLREEGPAKNQQKLPKSVHKKTKNGHIYLFICSIASVTRNVLPFCEPKTIPRGFPSK